MLSWPEKRWFWSSESSLLKRSNNEMFRLKIRFKICLSRVQSSHGGELIRIVASLNMIGSITIAS